jgi:hypothetical protein
MLLTFAVNDNNQAGVANLAQRLRHIVPRHMSSSGRPTVVLAHMDVAQARASGANGIAKRPLLDVHMKRIEHYLAGRVPNTVDNLNR